MHVPPEGLMRRKEERRGRRQRRATRAMFRHLFSDTHNTVFIAGTCRFFYLNLQEQYLTQDYCHQYHAGC